MTDVVLVTGGAGFIGSHLVDRLVQAGRRVVVFDNFDPYYARALKEANIAPALATGRATLVEGDIRSSGALRSTFGVHRPGAVVHLAARPGVRPSFEMPQLYLDINVSGTLNVLEACREFDVPKLVFASSSSVYGSVDGPAVEDVTPLQPLSPYGASKAAGEALCSAFARSAGTSVTALRFFTVYGPRQRPDMAVNRFTRMILGGEPVPLYGDGASQRDYTYVADIVSGVAAAVDSGRPGFEAINLGRGHPVILRNLLRLIELGLDRRAVLQMQPAQKGDPQSTCADVTRARETLGYEPRIPAQDGVIRYTEWFLEQQSERAGSR